MTSCPFARLGLPPDADLPALQDAWRRLARQHHPDLRPGDPHATAAFQAMSDARDRAVALLRARPADASPPDDPLPPSDPPAPTVTVPSWRARAAEPQGWRARTVPPRPWRTI